VLESKIDKESVIVFWLIIQMFGIIGKLDVYFNLNNMREIVPDVKSSPISDEKGEVEAKVLKIKKES